MASTLAYLRLPPLTGSLPVGRVQAVLIDTGRMEPRSGPTDLRRVPLTAWYPGMAGTSAATATAAYIDNLSTIREGLLASGELGAIQVAGLDLIRSNAHDGLALADADATYPVILLSPGNATNVAFYSSLAEDLASHGYVVIGIDHPYQVAAADLGNGKVAVYPGDGSPNDVEAGTAGKIAERVADIRFVLDRLAADGAGVAQLAGRLDLGHVGIAGHSNGGIAAVEACAADKRLSACLNIDGQAAGGPLAVGPTPRAPGTPFMYLTKEPYLHPALEALFESAAVDTYRVVVPAASHADFTDGPRFEPRLAPVDTTADAVLTIERGFAEAFFDHALRGAPETALAAVDARTDVLVSVYPLGDHLSPSRLP